MREKRTAGQPGSPGSDINSCGFPAEAPASRPHAGAGDLRLRKAPPRPTDPSASVYAERAPRACWARARPASLPAEGPRSRWGARAGPSLAVAGKNLRWKGRQSTSHTLTRAAELPAAAGCALRPPSAARHAPAPRRTPNDLAGAPLLSSSAPTFCPQLKRVSAPSYAPRGTPLLPSASAPGHSARSAQAVS